MPSTLPITHVWDYESAGDAFAHWCAVIGHAATQPLRGDRSPAAARRIALVSVSPIAVFELPRETSIYWSDYVIYNYMWAMALAWRDVPRMSWPCGWEHGMEQGAWQGRCGVARPRSRLSARAGSGFLFHAGRFVIDFDRLIVKLVL